MAMSWYVRAAGGKGYAPYEVREDARHAKDEGIVRVFVASVEDDPERGWGRVEPDHRVRARAQAFCDRLNAGGIARERALREKCEETAR